MTNLPCATASSHFRIQDQGIRTNLKEALNFVDSLICYRAAQAENLQEKATLLELHKVSHLIRGENGLDLFDRNKLDSSAKNTSAVEASLAGFSRSCDELITKIIPDYQANLFQAKYQKILASPANSFQELQTALSDATKRHLVILDIDNTLRNDVLVDNRNVYPDIHEPLREKLLELNQKPNTDIVFLTGRDKAEIDQSNLAGTELNLWASYGAQHFKEGLELSERVEQDRDSLFPEAAMIGKLDAANIPRAAYRMVTDPEKVYIFIKQPDLNPVRKQILDVFKGFNEKDWSMLNSNNRYLTFKRDKDKATNKGAAIPAILKKMSIGKGNAQDLNVYMFGDSNPDLNAMQALEKELGDSDADIYNCSVGWSIPKQEGSNFHRLASHESVNKLLLSL